MLAIEIEVVGAHAFSAIKKAVYYIARTEAGGRRGNGQFTCGQRISILLFSYRMIEQTAMTSNPESTRQLTSLLRDAIHVLDQWKVPHTLQPVLLGLGDNLKPREYNRYRLGTALSSNARVYRMAKKILHIDDATQKLFPFSLESARIWVTVGQPMLGGKSARAVVAGGDAQLVAAGAGFGRAFRAGGHDVGTSRPHAGQQHQQG
ncbi:MAG: hypothetical protein P8Z31_10485, partial [Gammaproteobacteria bacterium]